MKGEGKELGVSLGKKEEEKSVKKSENGEFGFVYEFFISEISGIEEELKKTKTRQEKRKDDLIDQSQTFFLPDFFHHE
ncbi:MAG: hypothetical protein FJ139_00965 [Deltaproteobacteria bacterium]|nr:hypothetical protein [Deltaproteobacteria bacterium]